MLFRWMSVAIVLVLSQVVTADSAGRRYFAHQGVVDRHGVVAPWYKGLNGQCDFRVRIAAETMKRYPWVDAPKTGTPAPEYMYNGCWEITGDGKITARKMRPWDDGDRVQRSAFAVMGLVDYYRYSGDPAAIAHICLNVDMLLNHCQTKEDHPWPRFLIGAPNAGEAYGECDPHGMIQLDLVGLFGTALTRAYQLTGRADWLDSARRWAELLADKRSREPGSPPWNRYANPEDVYWDDLQTGSVVLLLQFFDELIQIGCTGRGNCIVEARDAGRAYLRDVLLPRWTIDDTWARDYWDWVHTVQSETSSEGVARYMMRHPDAFPTWRADARNICCLFLHRACVSPKSNGGIYGGAWALPEGSQCCGQSLSYASLHIGSALAEYGVLTGSEWAREVARRQVLLATYDATETGVVEDNIDGGQVVAGGWFQIAHSFILAYLLETMSWMPEELGAGRENHILRVTSIVNRVMYGDGRIAYSTFQAPANTSEILRLAFRPTRVTADHQPLEQRPLLDANGYQIKNLSNGDWMVTIRHDGRREIAIEGDDPQEQIAAPMTDGPQTLPSNQPMVMTFEGNQVRVIGAVGPSGGLADVYLDDVKQLCGIDCWNPYELKDQVLYYRNGLSQGKHTLKLVALGGKNPHSKGSSVVVERVYYSAATGDAGFGDGGGPTDRQGWIFGYSGRSDYVDSQGQSWKPATEVVIRSGHTADAVAQAWYTVPRRQAVANTRDPVLYRYGMHGKDFTAFFTVGPGHYHVRIKMMETRAVEPAKRAMDIHINGEPVARNVDIAAVATGRPAKVAGITCHTRVWEGMNTAADLVFDDIKPKGGVIAVRFIGCDDAEAVVSAIELFP